MMNVFDKLSDTQRLVLSGLVGLLLGIVLASLWFISQGDGQAVTDTTDPAVMGESEEEDAPNVQEVLVQEGDRIDVDDQSAGLSVRITEVNLTSDGWVAVHEAANGTVGNILGAARFDKGVSRGTIELLRATVAGRTYSLRLYSDNGNRAFEPKLDPLVVGDDRQAIEDMFVAR